MPNRLSRCIRASRPTLPFTEMMSIGGSADVNTSIFVMEASYQERFLFRESGYSGNKQWSGGNRRFHAQKPKPQVRGDGILLVYRRLKRGRNGNDGEARRGSGVLDHIIVSGEAHLRWILISYAAFRT
jgi:hypothetical protein